MSTENVCVDCGKVIELPASTKANGFGGTGYGTLEDGGKVCYDCCGKRDLADLLATGKGVLYLTQSGKSQLIEPWFVSNWPLTLRFKVRSVSIGRHNIASVRYDVWFKVDGDGDALWHGVQYGNRTQLCHAKRTK